MSARTHTMVKQGFIHSSPYFDRLAHVFRKYMPEFFLNERVTLES